jgi:hypothetical protein
MQKVGWILAPFCLVISGLGACAGDSEVSLEEAATSLEGSVHLVGRLSDRPVEIRDFLDGVDGRSAAMGRSDASGAFSVAVGALSAPLLATVEVSDGGLRLRRIVTEAPIGKVTDAVRVTPVNHLVSQYAAYLIEQGQEWQEAVQKARLLLFEHFGGLEHEMLLPREVRQGAEDFELPDVLSDDVRLGMLLAALERLAEDLSRSIGLTPEGALTTEALIEALGVDIRADGKFDGLGPDGPLRLDGVLLSPNTLRADYGRALLGFLASDQNGTPFTPGDLELLAQAIATRRSEIFVDGPTEPLDIMGPRFVSVGLETAGGLPILGTVRGQVTVTATLSDESTVRTVQARLVGVPGDWLGLDLEPEWDRAVFAWDTTKLEDGDYLLRLEADDVYGNQGLYELPVSVDNTGIALDIRVQTVSGDNLDVRARPVRGQVVLEVQAQEPGTVAELQVGWAEAQPPGSLGPDEILSPDAGRYRIDTTLLPDGQAPLEIVAVDLAGNETRETVTLAVDNTPVSLTVASRIWTRTPQAMAEVGFDGEWPRRLTILINGQSVFQETPTRFSVQVPVTAECPGVLAGRVQAEDAAGNLTEVPFSLVCDDAVPRLALEPTAFIQARGASFRLSNDGRQVVYEVDAPNRVLTLGEGRDPSVPLEVFFHHLDEAEVPDERLAPRLRFLAQDNPVPGLPVDAAEVAVDYRFVFRGIVPDAWTPLAATRVGEPYTLPLSIQRFGRDLLDSRPEDRHAIDLRVRDAAGNETIRSLSFQLDLVSLPVWWRQCRLSSEVTSKSLPGRNVHPFYQSAEAQVGEGELIYPLGLKPNSLIPSGAIEVRMAQGAFRSRVTEAQDEMVISRRPERFSDRGPCLSIPSWRWTMGDDLGCKSGTIPQVGMLASQGFDLGGARPQGLIARGRVNGQAVSGVGTLLIPVDQPVQVDLSVASPTLWVNGQSVDWSTDVPMPNGFTRRGVEAYRLSPRLQSEGGLARAGEGFVVLGAYRHRVPFETRPFMSGLEMRLSPSIPEAQHPDLPHVGIPMRRLDACGSELGYETRLSVPR